MPAIKQDEFKRFASKLAPPNERGCSIYTGGCTPDGYGVFWYEGKSVRATRFAWFAATGEWPPCDQFVLHRCDTPACMTHDHHFLGDADANNKDRDAKGRSATGKRNGYYTKPETMRAFREASLAYVRGEGARRLAEMSRTRVRPPEERERMAAALRGRPRPAQSERAKHAVWDHESRLKCSRPSKNNTFVGWTAVVVLRLRAEKWSQQRIADLIGVDQSAVSLFLRKAGLKPVKRSLRKHAVFAGWTGVVVLVLRYQGWSKEELAALVGTDRGNVAGFLKRARQAVPLCQQRDSVSIPPT